MRCNLYPPQTTTDLPSPTYGGLIPTTCPSFPPQGSQLHPMYQVDVPAFHCFSDDRSKQLCFANIRYMFLLPVSAVIAGSCWWFCSALCGNTEIGPHKVGRCLRYWDILWLTKYVEPYNLSFWWWKEVTDDLLSGNLHPRPDNPGFFMSILLFYKKFTLEHNFVKCTTFRPVTPVSDL